MDKAVKTRTETYEQFASRLPTVDRRERGFSDELRGALNARERVNADLASLKGPPVPDPRKMDEEFEAELVQFRAFAKSFGEFAREFDADGVPTDRTQTGYARGGSADDANAKMVADFKAAVMKGDADYGAAGSRHDDLVRPFHRLNDDHNNDEATNKRSKYAVDRNGSLTVDTAPHAAFDPDAPPSDLETVDMGEGDTPFFLESPKMAKFDNWVPHRASSDDSDSDSLDADDDSKPTSSSEDSDEDSDDSYSAYEDEVEAAAMEEEKRLKAELAPILGGLTGSGHKKVPKGYGSASPMKPAPVKTVGSADATAPLRPRTTVTGGYGSGGVSPSAEAAANRTSPFVRVKGDDEEEDEDDEEGRASSGMLKRARRRLKGPGRWAVDEDSEGAEGADTAVPKHPSVAVDLVMFKIKCGKCSATLKIPAGVDVFRCPKCASKLRVPTSASSAQTNGQAASATTVKSNANKAMKELSDVARSTRDVITRHAAERRREATREALSESRAELIRHVEFSKSLEDVIDEMCRQVSARTGVAGGA